MSRSTVQRGHRYALAVELQPNLAGAIDAVVVPVDLRDLLLKLLIAAILDARGASPSVVVGRGGNRRAVLRQHRANRLDTPSQAIAHAMALALVDELHER